MITRFMKRLFRGGCMKMVYLSVFLTAFVLVSYQLKGGQSYAKTIEESTQVAEKTEDVVDDVVQEDEKDSGQPLPIMKNAEGDGISPPRIVKSPDVKHVNEDSLDLRRKVKPVTTGPFYIGNEKYPKLTPGGAFIPLRRIIQLDLKGAPYKVEFFTELFYFFKRIKATGVMIEWEDMFPYSGRLSSAVNSNAYSMDDVETILKEAKRHNLEVIPLVQTFGHLEWILKLEEFSHLREDKNYPQVICFPLPDAWELLKDMVDQVASVHRKFGMNIFHMGADEVFQVGVCNASVAEMERQGGSRDRLALWHISRMAAYVKSKYDVTVLAWHDMFAHVMESELKHYNMTELIEPVLWSYAEDLDMYLSRSTWMALTPFRRVWGSSAWKGADGPHRFNSNPIHYIRNHESWTKQFTQVYQDFEVVQGLIMTGWSRYDHLAILTELLPVAVPAMAMSMETILEARSLSGSYPTTAGLIECTLPVEMGYVRGCRFPGSKIYELVNEYWSRRKQLRDYRDSDFELNGWLSRVADSKHLSSMWYINKIQPNVEYHAGRIRDVEHGLRVEMAKIYNNDTVEEFIFTYLGEDLDWLSTKLNTIKEISGMRSWPKRPQFPDQAVNTN